MNRPLILITNDDSIAAKGIEYLVKAAVKHGDVVVVAPDKPQSGMGHAITISQSLRLQPSKQFEGVEAYTTSGTPVDCVKLAVYEILDRKPDLLISGINHGSNAATNVLYSGTMSAAIEGALEGIPSIGFSLLDHDQNADFNASMHIAEELIIKTLKEGMPEHLCLNVNIPKGNIKDIKGVKVCRQAFAHWADNFDKRKDPFGKDYYWMTGEFKNFDGGEDTDIFALNENFVSVVPIQFDMTAHKAMSSFNHLSRKG